MQIQNDIPEARGFSPAKVEKCYEELVEVFQKHKLSVREILIAYGNLGYTLGASIEGFSGQGPSASDLEKMYYTNPTVGVALMSQGLLVTSWDESYEKQQQTTESKDSI